MSLPILATKLYAPPVRANRVPRERLIARLNDGAHRKLTLVSAAAGCGKTSLISEWIALGGRQTAWLSLEEADNDLTRFLSYVIAAFQTVSATVGERTVLALQSPQPPQLEPLMTALLNDLAMLEHDVTLVLDDYHVIDSKPVEEVMAFMIEHLPSRVHLVMASRRDPQFPLARLRVRDQLTKLSGVDLRFTPDETTDFLNRVMGLKLSAAQVTALETRTEGWIAGLQLAGLSIQGRTNADSFIKFFTGTHLFVLDYLVEEVLHRQPAHMQRFLLRTSILDRLCGPLCEAVMRIPEGGGQETLTQIERANLFIVPLDDERKWYRYHHLFAELLRQQLQQGAAGTIADDGLSVAECHVRASIWFEEHDSPAEAIRHALAAGDFERMANLVEREWPAMHRSQFRSALTLGWMRALPDVIVRSRPVLSVGYAWELLNSGEMEEADARLRDAEKWIYPVTDAQETPANELVHMVVADMSEFSALPASVATARAFHALALGNVPRTITYAKRALDLYPNDDYVGRGPAAALLGLAYWAGGELSDAYRTLAHAMDSFRRAGNILFAISGTYGLADIRITQGRLNDAIAIYQQVLALARAQGEPPLQGTADLHMGLGELFHEQGDLQSAAMHLLASETLGAQAALPNWPGRWCVVQARIKRSTGDMAGTLALLDQAERVVVRGPVPDVRPIAALKARAWIVQGRLNPVLEWVRERGLSVDDSLSYATEFEHVTLARLLLAGQPGMWLEESRQAAVGLLQRLLRAAEEGGRMGSVIEILLLQALAFMAIAEPRLALASLRRALVLAEPEGYMRFFVDEGPVMAALLQEAAKIGIAPGYISRILNAFGAGGDTPPSTTPIANLDVSNEPLSDREREVLRLLATALNGPDIARELHVSLNTFRTHTKNIYSKLGVNNRRAASQCAADRGLL